MKSEHKASEDPRILKEIRQFLQTLNQQGGKPMEEMRPVEARSVLEKAQASVTVDIAGIIQEEKEISQDGMRIKIVVVKPEQSRQQMLPGFIFVHGGGWVLGDYPTHKLLVRDLVVESGAAAVFVDYSRSPEVQYPVAINEVYAAVKWVAGQGAEIGVDGANLAIAGNSVGGNMATVCCLMAKEKGGPALKFQLLLWPVTGTDFMRESWSEYAEERFLTAAMMKWMWDSYLPELEKRKDPYAAPLQASVQQLQGLPPAVIQLAENDILYDEGLAYARKLDEAGVPTSIQTFNGMIHDFGLLNALNDLDSVKLSVRQAALALRDKLFAEGGSRALLAHRRCVLGG